MAQGESVPGFEPEGVFGGGGGLGPGSLLQPAAHAAHVSNVYVYSHDCGRLTAVQAAGTRGPLLPVLVLL